MGQDAKTDIALVREARAGLGPDLDLMIDAGLVYDAKTAIQRARAFEQYDPFWFEEPLLPDDYEGYAKLSAASSLRIAAGEEESERKSFLQLMDVGKIDVVQVDLTRCGGFTEAMKIAGAGRGPRPAGRQPRIHHLLECRRRAPLPGERSQHAGPARIRGRGGNDPTPIDHRTSGPTTAWSPCPTRPGLESRSTRRESRSFGWRDVAPAGKRSEASEDRHRLFEFSAIDCMPTAHEIIAALTSAASDRGGFFRETYRSTGVIPADSLPPGYPASRPDRWDVHLLPADRRHVFRDAPAADRGGLSLLPGGPVRMLQIFADGPREIVIGNDILAGQHPQVIVPAGVWQGSRLEPGVNSHCWGDHGTRLRLCGLRARPPRGTGRPLSGLRRADPRL